MKKKIIAMAGALVLVFCLSVTAFAATAPGAGYGWCGGTGGGGFMWDDDGTFLDRDAFEERLDQYIEDGIIAAENKAAYLDRYDYCAEFGGGSVGVRGGGMGCGRGMGRR